MHNGAIISIEPRLCIKLKKCLICKNNKKKRLKTYIGNHLKKFVTNKGSFVFH